MINKKKVNIDKLELCYTAPLKVVEELINTKYREAEGYRLVSLDKDKEEALKSYLLIEVRSTDVDGSLIWKPFAELSIGSTFEAVDAPIRYVWIYILNESLYTPMYPSVPIVGYIWDIAEALGLEFHNITRLEIAIDTTANYFNKVKRAIKDEGYTPIVLGRAYEERTEIIDSLLYIHTGDRIRYRTGTMSVKDKERSFELCIYDKTKEIEKSGKDYITEWDGYSQIYRLEIRANSRALKEYSKASGRTQEDIYMNIINKELLFDMFLYFSDRALRFRQSNSREPLSVIQL